MPLPTPIKTWQFAHVVPTPTGSRNLDVASIIWGMKEALKSFGSSPWTVAGSNDGVTAAMDGVDRWTSPSTITFTGTSGATWIVLEAPAGWGGGQLLIYCDNGGFFASNIHTRWSLSGVFTGGNTTTVPTAADDAFHVADDLFDLSGIPGGGAQMAAHILHSTDGQNTRVFFSTNGVPTGYLCTETAGGGPFDNWTDPRVFGRGPTQTRQPLTNALLWNVGQESMRARSPSTGNTVAMSSLREATLLQLINEIHAIPNEISGETPLYPIHFYGHNVAGLRGHAGYLVDWWHSVSSVAAGDGFPGDGSKQFMAFGTGVVVPWDGTTPVLG